MLVSHCTKDGAPVDQTFGPYVPFPVYRDDMPLYQRTQQHYLSGTRLRWDSSASIRTGLRSDRVASAEHMRIHRQHDRGGNKTAGGFVMNGKKNNKVLGVLSIFS